MQLSQYTIATGYKLESYSDLPFLKSELMNLCGKLNLKGTMIISSEGINFTIAGLPDDIDSCYDFFSSRKELSEMPKIITYCNYLPFKKLKIKIREEVVNYRNADTSRINSSDAGLRCSPEDWDKLLMDENCVLIDVRNHYEYTLGTFKDAINPMTNSFSEFCDWINMHSQKWSKDTKIAMCCTAGIRCEKSTAYVKKVLGHQNVYHLKGGILNYLVERRKYNTSADSSYNDRHNSSNYNNSDLWNGYLFVFDDRIALSADDLSPLNNGILSCTQEFNDFSGVKTKTDDQNTYANKNNNAKMHP